MPDPPPRETRVFDLVVWGATGFTGERVVKQLAAQQYSGSWAIAGRSRSKLLAVLAKYNVPARDIPIIEADTADYNSLLLLTRQTRLVLACVGPYRLYGEPMVRACIQNATDYMDVCGEPEFIERMEASYFDHAATNGCYIVSAVGFDSVPAEFGCLYALQHSGMRRVHAIESFLTLTTGPSGAVGNFATFESAVLGFQHAGALRGLRTLLEGMPWRRRGRTRAPGPPLRRRTGPFFDPRLRCWALPFPGSDASVVRRQQQMTGTCWHYAAYFTVPSLSALLSFALFGSIAKWLAGGKWGRALLLRYPRLFTRGLFSKQGPTEQQMRETGFVKTLIVHGDAEHPSSGAREGIDHAPLLPSVPNQHVVCRVRGPEPGYVATPIILVNAALALLASRDRLGPGGVWTAGALLGKTDVIERLQEHGIVFEVVDAADAGVATPLSTAATWGRVRKAP